MTRVALGLFLIAHGLLHAGIYAMPQPKDKEGPFDPSYSWALTGAHVAHDSARRLSLLMGLITAGVFTLAGISLLAGWAAWVPVAVLGAATGLLLKGLYFNAWLSIGVLIDVAILWTAATAWPPSSI